MDMPKKPTVEDAEDVKEKERREKEKERDREGVEDPTSSEEEPEWNPTEAIATRPKRRKHKKRPALANSVPIAPAPSVVPSSFTTLTSGVDDDEKERTKKDLPGQPRPRFKQGKKHRFDDSESSENPSGTTAIPTTLNQPSTTPSAEHPADTRSATSETAPQLPASSDSPLDPPPSSTLSTLPSMISDVVKKKSSRTRRRKGQFKGSDTETSLSSSHSRTSSSSSSPSPIIGPTSGVLPPKMTQDSILNPSESDDPGRVQDQRSKPEVDLYSSPQASPTASPSSAHSESGGNSGSADGTTTTTAHPDGSDQTQAKSTDRVPTLLVPGERPGESLAEDPRGISSSLDAPPQPRSDRLVPIGPDSSSQSLSLSPPKPLTDPATEEKSDPLSGSFPSPFASASAFSLGTSLFSHKGASPTGSAGFSHSSPVSSSSSPPHRTPPSGPAPIGTSAEFATLAIGNAGASHTNTFPLGIHSLNSPSPSPGPSSRIIPPNQTSAFQQKEEILQFSLPGQHQFSGVETLSANSSSFPPRPDQAALLTSDTDYDDALDLEQYDFDIKDPSASPVASRGSFISITAANTNNTLPAIQIPTHPSASSAFPLQPNFGSPSLSVGGAGASVHSPNNFASANTAILHNPNSMPSTMPLQFNPSYQIMNHAMGTPPIPTNAPLAQPKPKVPPMLSNPHIPAHFGASTPNPNISSNAAPSAISQSVSFPWNSSEGTVATPTALNISNMALGLPSLGINSALLSPSATNTELTSIDLESLLTRPPPINQQTEFINLNTGTANGQFQFDPLQSQMQHQYNVNLQAIINAAANNSKHASTAGSSPSGNSQTTRSFDSIYNNENSRRQGGARNATEGA